jgi:hypothetical protein
MRWLYHTTRRGADWPELDGVRLGGVRVVRTDLPMLCKKSRATVFLRDGDPATGLAGDFPLGRLHSAPRARCLPRRAVMLLELTQGPPQRGTLPASTADTTRRNAGIVERLLSLLPAPRAAPSHPTDSTDREELRPVPTPLRSLSRPSAPPRGSADRRATAPHGGAVNCSADGEKAQHRDERQEMATALRNPKHEHHPSLCLAPTFSCSALLQASQCVPVLGRREIATRSARGRDADHKAARTR